MTAAVVLRAVRDAGGEVEIVAGDRLRLRAAVPLPPDLVEAVRVHKPALIALLRAPRGLASEPAAGPVTASAFLQTTLASEDKGEDKGEDADPERRAIIDGGDGILRIWAEGFLQMQRMLVPAGMTTAGEWAAIVDATGRLLDRRGRALSVLGWRTEDLFGVHLTRPMVRYEAVGLVRLLPGREVIDVAAETATLRCWDGAIQVYRRRPAGGAGWGLLWHLPPDGTV